MLYAYAIVSKGVGNLEAVFEEEKKSVYCAICIFVAWAKEVRFCPRVYLVLLFWLLFVRGEVGVGNSMVDRAICLLIL